MQALYTAEATAEGGRDGRARSSDGALDVQLTSPPEMGGRDGGAGTNPEQLFAAGYAACFQGAMQYVARQQRLSVEGSTVTARVGIGPREDGPGFGLQVALDVALPSLDREAAERLVASAHESCPYSNATRGNVDVKLEVA